MVGYRSNGRGGDSRYPQIRWLKDTKVLGKLSRARVCLIKVIGAVRQRHVSGTSRMTGAGLEGRLPPKRGIEGQTDLQRSR